MVTVRNNLGNLAIKGAFVSFLIITLSVALCGVQAYAEDVDEKESVDDISPEEIPPALLLTPTPAPSSAAEVSSEETSKEVETAPKTVEPMTLKPEEQPTAIGPELQKSSPKERRKILFGTYRVRAGAGKPTFDDGLKCYEKFYGSSKWSPVMGVDWYPFDWYVTVGFSGRLGFYSAKGYTATSRKSFASSECSDLTQNKNGPSSLFYFPMQLLMVTQFTPFWKKWLVIDAWGGVERLYFSETREQAKSSEAKSATAALMLADTSSSSPSSSEKSGDEGSYTNRGWKTSSVIGVAANILLNPLEERAVRSMNRTLNLGYVYLSPYYEIVRMMNKKGASFGRTSYGVMFTFETLN